MRLAYTSLSNKIFDISLYAKTFYIDISPMIVPSMQIVIASLLQQHAAILIFNSWEYNVTVYLYSKVENIFL